MITQLNADGVNTVSQLIQLSVAPVFLLAGVAGLLNVFTGRLSRIIDKVDKLDKYEEENILKDEKSILKTTREKFRNQQKAYKENPGMFHGTAYNHDGTAITSKPQNIKYEPMEIE